MPAAPDLDAILLLLGRLELQHKRLGLVNHAYGVRSAIAEIQQTINSQGTSMSNETPAYGSAEQYADLARQRADNFHAGPAGLPEGATAAFIPPAMQASWDEYWDKYRHNSVDETGGGGALVRIGPESAVYTRDGQAPIYLHRGSNLNALAHLDAAIAAEWLEKHGFVPVPLS